MVVILGGHVSVRVLLLVVVVVVEGRHCDRVVWMVRPAPFGREIQKV
jgi:hypothetical protein